MPVPTRSEQLERKINFLDAKCKCVRDVATVQRNVNTAFEQYWDGLITRDELAEMAVHWASTMKIALHKRIAKLEP